MYVQQSYHFLKNKPKQKRKHQLKDIKKIKKVAFYIKLKIYKCTDLYIDIHSFLIFYFCQAPIKKCIYVKIDKIINLFVIQGVR